MSKEQGRARPPLRVAITGPPAAGKSTVARMFAALGVPLFDADAAVAALYAPGGAAVAPLLARWPQLADAQGGISRAALRQLVLQDDAALAEIEAIVHPLVAEQRARFVEQAAGQGAEMVVLEIPLLFETGAQDEADMIILVDAPEAVRQQRLAARPGFSEELQRRLEARLLPLAEKRRHADIILNTDMPLEELQRQVRAMHTRLLAEDF